MSTIPNQAEGAGGLPLLVTVGAVTSDGDAFSELNGSNYALPDITFSPAAGMRYLGIEFTTPLPSSLSANAALLGLQTGGNGEGWLCWLTTAGQLHFEGRGNGGSIIRPSRNLALSAAGRYWVFLPIDPRTAAGGGVAGSYRYYVSGSGSASAVILTQTLSVAINEDQPHTLGNAPTEPYNGSELTFHKFALWDFGENPPGTELDEIAEGTSRHESSLIWWYDDEAPTVTPRRACEPGEHWIWLLEIRVQGRLLAYATEAAEPSGGPIFKPGLVPLVVERTPDLSDLGVAVEGGDDFTAMFAAGVVLETSPARVLLWPKGFPYTDAIVVLEGTLQDLELGARGRDHDLAATVRARISVPQLWPPASWVIDATTWANDGSPSIIAEPALGASYPIPIGYPGTGDSDASEGEPATPALLAYFDGAVFSGDNFVVVGPDILDATSVELIRVDANLAAGELQRAVVTLETEADQLGTELAVVKFPTWWVHGFADVAIGGNSAFSVQFNIPTDTPASGTVYLFNSEEGSFDAYPYSSYAGDTITLDSVTLSRTYPADTEVRYAGQVTLDVGGEYWVSFNQSRGGGIVALGESPLRTLGNVIIYALERSGEQLDRARAAVEADRLSGFKIDTVISGRVDPARWIDSELAPVFPIQRVQGPEGVFYRFMDYTATERDASLHLRLDDSGSCKLVGSVVINTAGLANQFQISYAPSTMGGSTKQATIGPTYQGGIGDGRIYHSAICALSAARYTGGAVVEGSPIVTPHVYADRTAYAALAHRAARLAFPVVAFEVECWGLPCVEVGTIALVSHTRLGLDAHPAIVVAVTLGGAWQVLSMELLRSPVLAP